MRILHTADWHLGHTLHDVPREFEHGRFFEWLLDQIGEREVDALLVAGDLFDAANPPARAQQAWFRFLGEARRRFRDLQIVAIGGNHDSAARLDAPDPVLSAFGVRVIGGVSRGGVEADLERLLVPLKGKGGEIGAWVAAVPYLRPCDLPAGDGEAGDALITGVRAAYAAVLTEAHRRAGDRTAVVAMGHLYLAGGKLSELSERKILGGNLHALPADVFPDFVAYAALGHLHLAQQVSRPAVRYAGSPLPLSLAERSYEHQVAIVELAGAKLEGVEIVRVPRWMELVRIPETGELRLDELLERIAAEPSRPAVEGTPEPLLEVAVRLERPEPAIRKTIQDVLEGKGLRLAKITPVYAGVGGSLGDVERGRALGELSPDEVFRRCWSRDFDGAPPEELLEAFHELLEQAQGDAP
ncbi:MAG: exonuclease SbcCD subunit D C-terminal domain-containing protein [Deltaproteobacteria bacterium]|nr:exonuclease SbcCD subunit D C-terminal domain-containing protein [Deltaproteobacteria bacterium]